MNRLQFTAFFLASVVVASSTAPELDHSPRPDEQQLPRAMRSRMKELPRITVGQREADIVGNDNRALQAAVDYVAGLGGGVVEIGEGEYLMRDSLHLRSNVVVRGAGIKTVLRKSPAVVSLLALDGDYGEEQVTLADPAGFRVGDGVRIWDDGTGEWEITVARITGGNGNTFSISKPLLDDCMVRENAKAATLFPVVSGHDIDGARIENLVLEGNKAENPFLIDGCRGGGIYLCRGFGTVIERCVVRDYNGDGISFQQSNDVTVRECIIEGNAALGLHPGSGSQRPIIQENTARHNGQDGLYLCWRVRHGLFERNILEDNGRYGISIGHKDSDNLLRQNQVRGNHRDGVYFRNESLGNAAHRNRLEDNLIENNGLESDAAGIRVRGNTRDLLFRNNVIRDTRPAAEQKQTVGILLEEHVGEIVLERNSIEAQTQIDDRRNSARQDFVPPVSR